MGAVGINTRVRGGGDFSARSISNVTSTELEHRICRGSTTRWLYSLQLYELMRTTPTRPNWAAFFIFLIPADLDDFSVWFRSNSEVGLRRCSTIWFNGLKQWYHELNYHTDLTHVLHCNVMFAMVLKIFATFWLSTFQVKNFNSIAPQTKCVWLITKPRSKWFLSSTTFYIFIHRRPAYSIVG